MSAGNMERVLRLMSEKGASDVYLSASSPILIKINGQLLQLSDQPLTHTQPRQLLAELLTPSQLEELEDTGELNVGVGLSGVGSFRLSGFKQRGTIAAVFRCIPFEIPTLESLNVPSILNQLVLEKRGLILMVGATGAGKSTTLASMIEQRNQVMAGHILTIEDPIEFLFNNKKSVINQREVGRDTQSLQIGLKTALRQAPDLIMIGEIRDRETMTAAISYALSATSCSRPCTPTTATTPSAGSCRSTRPEARPALLADLAAGLRAIVSQRLIRSVAGGRMPAVEVLLNTKLIQELIERGDFSGVKEAMEKSMAEGSQSFEQDLARMINTNLITRDEGLAYADSPTNLMWRMQNDMTPVSRIVPKKEETTTSRASPRSRSTCVRKKSPASRPTCAASDRRVGDARLAEQLIALPSVTPDDAGCQTLIAERLRASGFDCTALPFGPEGKRVSNLWAHRPGSDPTGKLLVFAGHTDVVPTGPLAAWSSDPFVPTHRGGKLYGRGAADMKSSIAPWSWPPRNSPPPGRRIAAACAC
jgi:twitching motility protein PilU